MILPDANLLIYAHNRESPQSEKAYRWWFDCLKQRKNIALPWATSLAFLRISTNHRIVDSPLSVSEVLKIFDYWHSLPNVHIPHPTPRHYKILRRLIKHLGTAANLTTDAHLAALALEHGYTIYSNDSDFARFPELKWKNPLL